ncbi:hypothetical protein BGLA2_2350015 [Burkholderia gladioli]|nr:hypothetical protein BGLA2_2350015 [Burkholderia gladioli]
MPECNSNSNDCLLKAAVNLPRREAGGTGGAEIPRRRRGGFVSVHQSPGRDGLHAMRRASRPGRRA